MTAKEKAKELADAMGMSKSSGIDYHTGKIEPIPQNIYAKECALILVDEILKTDEYLTDFRFIDEPEDSKEPYQFWRMVKEEIKKL